MSEEDAARNYIENLAKIDSHNKRTNESYTRGAAVDADMTFAEKKINRTGIKFPNNRKTSAISISQILKNVTTPNAGKSDSNFRLEKFLLEVILVNYTSFFQPAKDQVRFQTVKAVELTDWFYFRRNVQVVGHSLLHLSSSIGRKDRKKLERVQSRT